MKNNSIKNCVAWSIIDLAIAIFKAKQTHKRPSNEAIFFWEKYVGIGDGKKIIKLQMHIFAQHSSKAITYVYAYMFVLLNQFYCWFTSFFDAVVLDGCGVGLICTHNISLGHWLRFTLTNVAKFLSPCYFLLCRVYVVYLCFMYWLMKCINIFND